MKSFFQDLGLCIKTAIEDRNSLQYLTQMISITDQRGNASSILGTIRQAIGPIG